MKFSEKVRKGLSAFKINAGIFGKEEVGGMKGEFSIKAYDMAQDGRLVYQYKHSNIIVNTNSILLARLLKNSSEPSAGISYLAVGSGSGEWDTQDPPAPTTSQTELEGEFFRKAIDETTFVHPQTGEPTSSFTNVVDYCVTFGEGEAVGPMVEMGLFGGDATVESGTGTMVNWRTFPVVNKTSTMIITVVIRITT